MSQQRHDTGWKKRNRPSKPRAGDRINTAGLARDLVNRGLADPLILGNIRPNFHRNNK